MATYTRNTSLDLLENLVSNVTHNGVTYNLKDKNAADKDLSNLSETGRAILDNKRMPIGTIYQAIRTDIPVGSLRLDGTEYLTGFDGFITNYLSTGKIIYKTYAEWETEYTMTGGNVGFFGYDEATGAFKTPCIQAGTFLAQAVLSGEFGSFLNSALKSHTHTQASHTHTRGTMNIKGSQAFSGTDPSTLKATASGAFTRTLADGAGGSHDYVVKNSKVTYSFDASRSWTGSTSSAQPTINATGGSDTYPKHIRYPFFVIVSNVEAESPAQVDWDNFVGNLDSKANIDGSNMSESIIKFDGQWVNIYKSLLNKEMEANEHIIVDLSSILPDDDYDYECLLRLRMSRGDTSGANSYLVITRGSDDAPSAWGNTHVWGSLEADGANFQQAEGICFIVLNSRSIRVSNFGVASQNYVYGVAYRRLGTNN